MNLFVTKSGLGHTLEQADPSPRNSSDLPLIGHCEVLYLCWGYDSGQMVKVPLHLAKHPVGLSSI
jgi:hypothetical protein